MWFRMQSALIIVKLRFLEVLNTAQWIGDAVAVLQNTRW